MTEKLIEALVRAIEFIKAEREDFFECNADWGGFLEDEDAKALSDMDEIINQAEAAIKEAQDG